MRKILHPLLLLAVISISAMAQPHSSADTVALPFDTASAAAECPASHPLYCATVDRCCPSGHGYYCTNWQNLPDPSPLGRPLSGPCLNIQGFTSGQQYYLEKYCSPHGCG